MMQDGTTREWIEAQWKVKPTVFRVEVEGVSLAARGWNLATDLPGLILVHGFRAHARWWDHIAPALARSHKVVAFDLSGMGDSERRPAYSVAQYSREILSVADATGLVRPNLIAHSFGGLCAMLACREAPGRIERLIVIDSPLPSELGSARRIILPPRRVYPSRAAGIARFRLVPPAGCYEPTLLHYIAAHSLREDPDGWTWKFDADDNAIGSLRQEEYLPNLLDLPVDAEVILGELSDVSTPAVRAQIPKMLPRSGEPVVLRGCHHHVPLEQPKALIATLRSLLKHRGEKA